jgi:membrane-bound lytic murein transglycosylase MltF
MSFTCLRGVVVALAVFGASAPALAQSTGAQAETTRQLRVPDAAWTGDFDKMFERRVIRVVAPYSRSLYFNDKGRERGISAEFTREFERYLNTKYKQKLGKRPLTLVISATTREQLLPKVAEGRAEIALGNLTVTPERLKLVDMVSPREEPNLREIVLTGSKSPTLGGLDDLSGKTVHVRRASSYYESLEALNQRFRAENKPPINVVFVPDALEDEDMMEMLNTGLLQTIVVDEWKAKLWAFALPNIVLRSDLVVRDGGRLGWAVKKGNTLLAAEMLDFYAKRFKMEGSFALRLRQLAQRIKQFRDSTEDKELKRFETTVALFEKYGSQYRFDPLMLAAQGYQESRLDHGAKSAVGAIGIMQIMPATGQEMKVGDIRQVEPNIHAGAKYMDQLMTRYFRDANFTEEARTLFAFASYNCGPSNVSTARRLATQRGLDPDKWFNNVEIVIAQRIGMETTTYVRNIYKYYVAYKLIVDAQRQREQARSTLAPAQR